MRVSAKRGVTKIGHIVHPSPWTWDLGYPSPRDGKHGTSPPPATDIWWSSQVLGLEAELPAPPLLLVIITGDFFKHVSVTGPPGALLFDRNQRSHWNNHYNCCFVRVATLGIYYTDFMRFPVTLDITSKITHAVHSSWQHGTQWNIIWGTAIEQL